tara:strand:+ start:1044 stop:1175 length:132 start_codon:yes stop_codon:yes gene_type:complete
MKKTRQYRSNQGRSPKQQKGNEIAAFISFVGLIAVLTYIILTN